jgi:hypothetical protein
LCYFVKRWKRTRNFEAGTPYIAVLERMRSTRLNSIHRCTRADAEHGCGAMIAKRMQYITKFKIRFTIKTREQS